MSERAFATTVLTAVFLGALLLGTGHPWLALGAYLLVVWARGVARSRPDDDGPSREIGPLPMPPSMRRRYPGRGRNVDAA
jgi:hypothetical protein